MRSSLTNVHIPLTRACFGMEWKMVWKGRRILVWNMEDTQNGMEDLKNGMEGRLPYFHTNCIYSIYQNLQQSTKCYQTIE